MTVTACPLLPSHATVDAAPAAPSVGGSNSASSFALLLGDLIGVLNEAGIVPGVPQAPNRPAGTGDATVLGSDSPKGITASTPTAGSPQSGSPQAALTAGSQTADTVSPLPVLEQAPPEGTGREKATKKGGSDEVKDEQKRLPGESQQVLVTPAVTVAQAPPAPLILLFTPVLRAANGEGADRRTDPLVECDSETDSVPAAPASAMTVARVLSDADAQVAVGLRASPKLRGDVPKTHENPVPSPVPRVREGESEDSLDLAFAAQLQPKTEKRGEPQLWSPAPSAQRDIASAISASQQPDVAMEGDSRREPDSRDRERKPGTERSESPAKPVGTPSATVGDDARIAVHASPVAPPAHVGVTLATSPVPSPQSAPTAGSERPAASPSLSQETAEPTPPPATPPQSAISIRLGEAGQDRVDVRLQERQGTVQVVVRSSNPDLTTSLRGDLNDLVSRLEGRGYQTETWTPTGNVVRPTEPNGHDPRQDGNERTTRGHARA
ncbi:MAG: hypothetical protein ABI693_25680, partial [Bryobacteraceae bacterium]